MKKTLAGLLLGAMILGAGGTAALAEIRPIRMERVGVIPAGGVAMDLGLAYEVGREAGLRDYDNLRLAPLGIRLGLGDNIEVGGFLGFSSNSDDDAGAPDDSGLEGLTLFGKVALNPSLAVQFGVTFLGDDDIAPYSNDGLDLFVNVPVQRQLGPGLVYGQFGYRVQGGDFDINSYFNYGVGYAYPVNGQVALNVELVGEEARITAGGATNDITANTLDLVFGANLTPNPNLIISPYLSLGLYDASPDIAAGAMLQVLF